MPLEINTNYQVGNLTAVIGFLKSHTACRPTHTPTFWDHNQLIINNISLPQAPHSHIPYGQEGSGHYSDNTIGCYNVIQECVALTVKAIRSTVIKPTQVFTIADYGCADGGTSMPLLYKCVEELRRIHGCELAVHVMYEDQPVNDFKALFLRLQGISLNRISQYL